MNKLSIGAALVVLFGSEGARAAIPSGYAGTPFKGTPWPIPGRIEFENFDDGGQGVGWRVDDSTANFGQTGCAANDYRTEVHPQLCQTNTSPGENDLFSTGAQQGKHYPSDAMPQSIYLGYTHPSDWVKLTVNVAQAGKYQLSSTWASDPGGANGIHFQISFNDVMKADTQLTGTGSYHNWVEFPAFATVDLEAGVQVLQFAPKSFHLNYDYLQLSLMRPDGTVDSGNPGAGGSGGASPNGGASGATSEGGSAAGGATTAGGAGGSAGSKAALAGSGTGGGITGEGGQLVSNAGATSNGGSSAPGTTDPTSGCSVRAQWGPYGHRWSALFALVGLCGLALMRRRRAARLH